MSAPAEEKPDTATYDASCHCGYIKFSVRISPPLPQNKPLNCDCSACRRFGYLLTYMPRQDVTWHGDSWTRLSRYQFNTKKKDQLFCGRCGASIGIDFREAEGPTEPSSFGISVRTFNGIDLDALEYRKLHGVERVSPPMDLSGVQYELDEKEMAEKEQKDQTAEAKAKAKAKAKAEEELASAALTA